MRNGVSGLYGRGELFAKARPALAERKPQASHRAVRVGTKAGAVTVMRPDADGHLRQVSVERSVKRVRWDAAGLFVERA
jgi:hypothetical protein